MNGMRRQYQRFRIPWHAGKRSHCLTALNLQYFFVAPCLFVLPLLS